MQGRHRGIPRLTHEQQFQSESKHLFVNGHSLTMRFLERPDQARQTHGITAENREAFEEYYRQTLAESERRLGSLRARRLQLGNHSLFPNGVLGLRLAHPRGPLQTEFWHFVVLEKDMPEELKTALRRGSANYNGVNGIFEQGRHGQLARRHQFGAHRHGPQVRARPLNGPGPRPAASRLSRPCRGTIHLGKQPAALLPPLGAVYERRELGGHPLEPKVMDYEGTATLRG